MSFACLLDSLLVNRDPSSITGVSPAGMRSSYESDPSASASIVRGRG